MPGRTVLCIFRKYGLYPPLYPHIIHRKFAYLQSARQNFTFLFVFFRVRPTFPDGESVNGKEIPYIFKGIFFFEKVAICRE